MSFLHACMHLQKRVPFQYLIASAHWRTYVLSVGPGVLIPRPETEIFPDLAAQALKQHPSLASLPWCDLGTGSGAIAISVADELRKRNKSAHLLAVDKSPTAAAYARANAEATGLSKHVSVLEGSWYEPVVSHLSSQKPATGAEAGQSVQGRLGGIVSNPPYIPQSVMEAGLQAEVGLHEPWSALDGGPGPGMDSLQVGEQKPMMVHACLGKVVGMLWPSLSVW